MPAQKPLYCDQCGDDGTLPNPDCPACDGTGLMNPIANALKSLRSQTPYNQLQFARIAGVDLSRYSSMERGMAREYNVRQLMALAEFTNSHLVVRFDRYE